MKHCRLFFARLYAAIACCVALSMAACGSPQPTPSNLAPTAALPTPTSAPTATPRPTPTSTPTATVRPSPTSTLTAVPPSPTITPASQPPALPTSAPAGVAAPPGVDAEGQKAELLGRINELRAGNGCQPLQIEARIQQAAQAHAQDMRDHQQLDHTGSDGAQLSDRLDRVGYPYERAGENITNWFRTPQEVMQQWTEGPEIPDGPHRKNILNCVYTEAGIGLAYRDDGVPYWVLDLASRAS